TSPLVWPPMPSETTNNPRLSSTRKQSSFVDRTRPISLEAPTSTNKTASFLATLRVPEDHTRSTEGLASHASRLVRTQTDDNRDTLIFLIQATNPGGGCSIDR